MTEQTLRLPAEWEPQSAILLAWPHAGTDWAERLGEVEETYIALVAAITRFQPVWICVADDDLETYAEARLRSNRIDMDRVRFVPFDYDDTWLRDSGPITLRQGEGFRVLDFRFTAWGGKFEAGRDDRLVESLGEQGVFGNAPLSGRWFRWGSLSMSTVRVPASRRPSHSTLFRALWRDLSGIGSNEDSSNESKRSTFSSMIFTTASES